MRKRLIATLTDAMDYWVSARVFGKDLSKSHKGLQGPSIAGAFERAGRKFLHVGCGTERKPNVPPCFLAEDWQEIRVDIDPSAEPDILCSTIDMARVPHASVDAVYSSHNIEHLYAHEVPLALAEFFRVLKPGGFLLMTCPDLQAICRIVADGMLNEPLYTSQVGPIFPLDILYGYRPQIAAGNLFMAHRTGFVLQSLGEALRSAGFCSVAGRPPGSSLDLWVVATSALLSEDELGTLAKQHLPQ